MDYTGLLAKKYRVNRKLTDEERSNQLRQKVGLDIRPSCNVSVVRMNSTYLECVDRWFVYRGWMSAICLSAIGLGIVAMFGWLFWSSSPHVIPTRFDINWMIFSLLFLTPFWALMIWAMFND